VAVHIVRGCNSDRSQRSLAGFDACSPSTCWFVLSVFAQGSKSCGLRLVCLCERVNELVNAGREERFCHRAAGPACRAAGLPFVHFACFRSSVIWLARFVCALFAQSVGHSGCECMFVYACKRSVGWLCVKKGTPRVSKQAGLLFARAWVAVHIYFCGCNSDQSSHLKRFVRNGSTPFTSYPYKCCILLI